MNDKDKKALVAKLLTFSMTVNSGIFTNNDSYTATTQEKETNNNTQEENDNERNI